MSKIKQISRRILRPGKWIHPQAPNGVLEITKDYMVKLKDNFQRSPYVPVYRGHVRDSEAEKNPELILSKNIKDLQVKEDGLYATMEVPEEAIDKYNDLSAGIENEYIDAESGQSVGQVLKHIAFTVNPYIKKLNPLGLSDQSKENYLIYLSEIQPMEDDKKTTSEEELNQEAEETKAEETKAEETEAEEEESTEEAEATQDEPEKSEEEAESEEKSEDDESEADETEESKEEAEVIENSDEAGESYEDLQKKVVELTDTVNKQSLELSKQQAEADYNDLLKKGKITPAMKEPFIELSRQAGNMITLSDGKKSKSVGTLVKELLEKAPSLVNLSSVGINHETGDNPADVELSGDFIADLRKRNSSMSDDEFNEYIEKNKDILVKYSK